MKNADMVKALYGLAKKGVIENHQECELIRAAALRVTDLAKQVQDLQTEISVMNQMSIAMEDDGK